MSDRIYLDHAATAPVLPEVREAVARVLKDGWGNPSSVHAEGRRARAAVEQARREAALLAGCAPQDVLFTSGGTEANALCVLGVLAACNDPRAPLVLSAVEHESLRRLAERAEKSGRPVALLAVDRTGAIDLARLEELLRTNPRPALVSVMSANNETGTLFPVQEIAARCADVGVVFHADAVQAAGKSAQPVAGCGAALLSLSGHKLGTGPGVGAAVVRGCERIAPVLGAGHQERGLRGGTENLAGIVAFGAAARYWRERGEEIRGRIDGLGAQLGAWLESLDGVRLNARESARLPSTMSVRFEGVSGEALLQALDLERVSASLGAACASGSLEPSAILLTMGYSDEEAAASVRLSLGWSTTAEEIARFQEKLPPLLARLRRTRAAHQAARRAREG